jgi:hypothetical protein
VHPDHGQSKLGYSELVDFDISSFVRDYSLNLINRGETDSMITGIYDEYLAFSKD